MIYYTEGTIKKASIAGGTFSISPRKEYMHEEGGKKLLLAVEEKAIAPNGNPPFHSLLLSETSEFSFSRHVCPLIMVTSSKTLVGIKFEINALEENEDSTKIKSSIKVIDLIVL